MKKQCTACKLIKSLKNFYNQKRGKYGKHSSCKECYNEKIKPYQKKYWTSDKRKQKRQQKIRTFDGVIQVRWESIANGRKSLGYENIKTLLTKEEFLSTVGDEFKQLYQNWKESNFQYRLTPSIDRIDPRKHYEIGNIRWITQGENASLGARSKRLTRQKAIAKYSKDGVLIQIYTSLSIAGKEFGLNSISNISASARGKIPSAYGYIWKYVNKDISPKIK